MRRVGLTAPVQLPRQEEKEPAQEQKNPKKSKKEDP